jgi:hypothetical protein
MGYLKSQLSRFRKWRRPVALESSVLGKIPLELLLQITEHLPAPSAAAFSISCMQIKCLIGDRYLRNLVGRPANKIAFLDILALDLPDQVVCPICQRLHKMENATRYIPRRTAAACLFDDENVVLGSLTGVNFSTTLFRMAMKRYQQNPECSQLLKLLSYRRTKLESGYVNHYKEDCRIIQGIMIHRVQKVYLSIELITLPFLEICRHLNFGMGKDSTYVGTSVYCGNDLEQVWSTNWNLASQEKHNNGSGLMRCPHCWTEFRFDFKYYPGYKVALFFTRWKNLGSGPADEDWTRNFQRSGHFPPKTDQFQAGPLSSVFEDSDDFKLDSLLSYKSRMKLQSK